MPGFTFPSVGRLGITSPPSRPKKKFFFSVRRYYVPPGLPHVRLRLVRYSLSSPDTPYRPSLVFVFLFRLADGRDIPVSAGISLLPDLLIPSFYAGKHADLASSRANPVSACPALRPRRCPGCLPHCRIRDCCLPVMADCRLSLFTSYPDDHDDNDFGAQ